MKRLQDMYVTEAIGFTDATGRISELEVKGHTLVTSDGSDEDTWMLLHIREASFRMSTAEDNEECILTGLDIYAPESLLSEGMPEGITSLTIAHGFHCYVGTVTGTRRAISDFVRDNWTDGSDDADEQLASWMDLVTVQS